MRVYFGGCERPNAIHTLAKAGGKRVMISYAEPPTENCWKLYREYGIEIMADSGAYSAWKRGIELSLEGYMNWLQENNIKQYFNMDVVGDPKASMANLQKMEDAGFTPIPVFHYGTPWRVLDDLFDRYRYSLIGIGGTVGQSYSRKVAFFEELFSRYPDGNFHGLGIASSKLLEQFPFVSCDSVWWVYKYRSNQARLAPGKGRKEEQAARVKHLLNLEQVDRRHQMVLICEGKDELKEGIR